MQEKFPDDDAPTKLRQLLHCYHARQQVRRPSDMSDKGYANMKSKAEAAHKDSILETFDESMRGNFHILANFFHADAATVDTGLKELIPDSVLRPFLTPTSGVAIPEGRGCAVLKHNGITELVMRCNLRTFFRGDDYDSNKYAPVFDEDYEYFAHIALLPTESGRVKAVTSWGGFYDHYATLTADEHHKLLSDLAARKYPRLLHLLTQSNCKFERVCGIGGFTFCLDSAYEETDVEAMAQAVEAQLRAPDSAFQQIVAAAVEVWQGARLLVWRQLLQRHVLLHKMPVADMPSVISADPSFDAQIAMQGGAVCPEAMAAALSDKAAAISQMLQRGQLVQSIFSFLSASLVLLSLIHI